MKKSWHYFCIILMFCVTGGCKQSFTLSPKPLAVTPTATLQRKMVYTGTGYDLWLNDFQGTNPLRLPINTSGLYKLYPAWSPDGSRIAFNGTYNTSLTTFDLFVVNRDGSGLTQITTGHNFQCVRWSPDGTRILTLDDDTNFLWVVNADGTHLDQVTTDYMNFESSFWTPDGTEITHVLNNEMIAIDANASGTTRTILNATSPYPPRGQLSWSPDGTKIAYQDTSYRICSINANGTGSATLTGPLPSYTLYITWSWDGAYLAFDADMNGDSDREAWVISADGTNPHQVSNDDTKSVGRLKFSRTENYLFYTTYTGGQVHSVRPDGSNNVSLSGVQTDWFDVL